MSIFTSPVRLTYIKAFILSLDWKAALNSRILAAEQITHIVNLIAHKQSHNDLNSLNNVHDGDSSPFVCPSNEQSDGPKGMDGDRIYKEALLNNNKYSEN